MRNKTSTTLESNGKLHSFKLIQINTAIIHNFAKKKSIAKIRSMEIEQRCQWRQRRQRRQGHEHLLKWVCQQILSMQKQA